MKDMDLEEYLFFYRRHKRFPTIADILLWQESKASVALDNDSQVQTMYEGKVVEDE